MAGTLSDKLTRKLQRANEDLRHGDLNSALRKFQEAALNDEFEYEGRIGKARVYIQRRNWPTARTELRKLKDRNFQSKELTQMLAHVDKEIRSGKPYGGRATKYKNSAIDNPLSNKSKGSSDVMVGNKHGSLAAKPETEDRKQEETTLSKQLVKQEQLVWVGNLPHFVVDDNSPYFCVLRNHEGDYVQMGKSKIKKPPANLEEGVDNLVRAYCKIMKKTSVMKNNTITAYQKRVVSRPWPLPSSTEETLEKKKVFKYTYSSNDPTVLLFKNQHSTKTVAVPIRDVKTLYLTNEALRFTQDLNASADDARKKTEQLKQMEEDLERVKNDKYNLQSRVDNLKESLRRSRETKETQVRENQSLKNELRDLECDLNDKKRSLRNTREDLQQEKLQNKKAKDRISELRSNKDDMNEEYARNKSENSTLKKQNESLLEENSALRAQLLKLKRGEDRIDCKFPMRQETVNEFTTVGGTPRSQFAKAIKNVVTKDMNGSQEDMKLIAKFCHFVPWIVLQLSREIALGFLRKEILKPLMNTLNFDDERLLLSNFTSQLQERYDKLLERLYSSLEEVNLCDIVLEEAEKESDFDVFRPILLENWDVLADTAADFLARCVRVMWISCISRPCFELDPISFKPEARIEYDSKRFKKVRFGKGGKDDPLAYYVWPALRNEGKPEWLCVPLAVFCKEIGVDWEEKTQEVRTSPKRSRKSGGVLKKEFEDLYSRVREFCHETENQVHEESHHTEHVVFKFGWLLGFSLLVSTYEKRDKAEDEDRIMLGWMHAKKKLVKIPGEEFQDCVEDMDACLQRDGKYRANFKQIVNELFDFVREDGIKNMEPLAPLPDEEVDFDPREHRSVSNEKGKLLYYVWPSLDVGDGFPSQKEGVFDDGDTPMEDYDDYYN